MEKCIKCDDECQKCLDKLSCLLCNDGFFIGQNNKCERCSDGCAKCNNSLECKICYEGYIKYSHSLCLNCALTSYKIIKFCYDYGKFYKCNNFEYLNSLGKCSSCELCTDYLNCEVCQLGKLLPVWSSSVCINCPPEDGFVYYNWISQLCLICSSSLDCYGCNRFLPNGNCIEDKLQNNYDIYSLVRNYFCYNIYYCEFDNQNYTYNRYKWHSQSLLCMQNLYTSECRNCFAGKVDINGACYAYNNCLVNNIFKSCKECRKELNTTNDSCEVATEVLDCLLYLSNNECILCAESFYLDINGYCQKCQNHCLKCQNVSQCDVCLEMYTVTVNNECEYAENCGATDGKKCLICQDGYYLTEKINAQNVMTIAYIS